MQLVRLLRVVWSPARLTPSSPSDIKSAAFPKAWVRMLSLAVLSFHQTQIVPRPPATAVLC